MSNCFRRRLPAASCGAPPQPGLRVRILGPLEARLTESDRVVLGGLVEGTWPPESNTDAWLSRPMRLALGLDLPERRIGLTAHDFAQLLGAREVILSHAAKIAGTPTVPSRFIQRLAAVAGTRWQAAVDTRRNISRLGARARSAGTASSRRRSPRRRRRARRGRKAFRSPRSKIGCATPIRSTPSMFCGCGRSMRSIPSPAPPNAARSSTPPSAISRKRFARDLPADPVGELIALGEPHFAALEDFPEARAFWWPRFLRIAHWFARWEAQRRADIAAIAAEIRGEIEIPLAEGTFKLRGVADRIERDADGRYVILDYKTGAARSEKQVRTGLAPQLTLEAAILRRGGFKHIAAGASVADIAYVLLKGGEPPGEYKPIAFKEGTPDSQADRALEKLARPRPALRGRERTVSLARPSDVDEPLRRLRPSRARQGMVEHRRRRSMTAAANENAGPHSGRRCAELQRAVADPAVSAWVAANAGSGKTHVLAQRVINLLLEGVEPEKILCITFTKAAAANMAKRVFDTLAAWTTLDDAALDDAIRARSGMTPDAARRALARRLFARALETPGGLKVQTIHAFCTQLLHQFPFEANVAARFTVLDETEQTQLLEQLTLAVLLDGARDPDSPLGRALAIAMTAAADQTFRDVVRAAIGRRDAISRWVIERRRRRRRDRRTVARARPRAGRDPSTASKQEFFAGSLDRAAGMAGDRGRPGARRQDRRRTGAPLQPRWLAAARRPRRDLSRHFLHRTKRSAAQIHRHQVDQGRRLWSSGLTAEQARVCALLDRRNAVICRDRSAALAHRRRCGADALSPPRKSAAACSITTT